MAAAQVPPLHVQLAPMGLLGVMLPSVTLALHFLPRCARSKLELFNTVGWAEYLVNGRGMRLRSG
eukprot:scaffold105912_cov24-Phaeocystis_antarctica.AAC.1